MAPQSQHARHRQGPTAQREQYHAGGGIGQRADIVTICTHHALAGWMTLTSSARMLS